MWGFTTVWVKKIKTMTIHTSIKCIWLNSTFHDTPNKGAYFLRYITRTIVIGGSFETNEFSLNLMYFNSIMNQIYMKIFLWDPLVFSYTKLNDSTTFDGLCKITIKGKRNISSNSLMLRRMAWEFSKRLFSYWKNRISIKTTKYAKIKKTLLKIKLLFVVKTKYHSELYHLMYVAH